MITTFFDYKVHLELKLNETRVTIALNLSESPLRECWHYIGGALMVVLPSYSLFLHIGFLIVMSSRWNCDKGQKEFPFGSIPSLLFVWEMKESGWNEKGC